MLKLLSLVSLSAVISYTCEAANPLVLPNNSDKLSLSIYNDNLALVKDSRPADLANGINDVIFDGVARNIQPETAIIYGQDIKVLEQNYSYNLMSEENLTEHAIGQKVNTVRQNPENGKNIFENAELLGVVNGRPILRFDYGIDPSFNGRILFDSIPADLSNKPILNAKIFTPKSADKMLNLAYLTSGLGWKTDYVANVINGNTLDLTGWVTINNESGVDYNNAKIQLIAGNVNIVRAPIRTRGVLMMKAAMYDAGAAMNSIDSIEPESINSYELYTLPNTATIKDKQTKQISLLEKQGVKYSKEFNLHSPLYLSDSYKFEKRHPDITFVIKNSESENLGISLPVGTIRFYEKDKNGNLQFIGSNNINNTAKEETLRLNLGEAFNISVDGKINKVSSKEVSRKPNQFKCIIVKTLTTYDAEVTFTNSEKEKNTVIFKQNVADSMQVVKENIKSISENAVTKVWNVKIAPESKSTLTFSIENTSESSICK